MGRAIAEWLLELVSDLSALVGRETFIGNCWPGNVTAEFFELVALTRFTDGSSVERESWLLGEQGGREGIGLRWDGAQGQRFAAGIGADADAVVDGGADQLIEGLARLEVEEGVVRVPDEEPLGRRALRRNLQHQLDILWLASGSALPKRL